MVYYYRDMWKTRSHMIAPLIDLVGEVGETKVTLSTGAKKKKWYWTLIHQDLFDHTKHTLAEEVLLAYPSYRELFEIYTDAL